MNSASSITGPLNSLRPHFRFLGRQVSAILAGTEQVIICYECVVFFSQILASTASTNLRSPETEFEVEVNLRVPRH